LIRPDRNNDTTVARAAIVAVIAVHMAPVDEPELPVPRSASGKLRSPGRGRLRPHMAAEGLAEAAICCRPPGPIGLQMSGARGRGRVVASLGGRRRVEAIGPMIPMEAAASGIVGGRAGVRQHVGRRPIVCPAHLAGLGPNTAEIVYSEAFGRHGSRFPRSGAGPGRSARNLRDRRQEP